VAPPPLLNPADNLRRRGDLASTSRQPKSLAPTAQWVTSGEDSAMGILSRQKIQQGAMSQGRSRSPSSKWLGTYPMPSWRLAGEYIRQRAFHVFNAAVPMAWKVARNRDFWRFDMEVATLSIGECQ